MNSFKEEREIIVYERAPRRITINKLPDNDVQDETIEKIYIENDSYRSLLCKTVIDLIPVIMGTTFVLMFVSIFLIHAQLIQISVSILVLLVMILLFLVIYKSYSTYLNNNFVIEFFNRYFEIEYDNKIKAKNQHIYNTVGQYISDLMSKYPSVSECIAFNEYNNKLWNKSNKQKDFLTYRIGTCSVNNIPHISDKINYQNLSYLTDETKEALKNNIIGPVCLDISKYKIIGLAGEYHVIKKLFYGLVGQIAINNCYIEVKMAFVYDGKKDKWNRFEKLPHVWSNERDFKYIADNKNKADELFTRIINNVNDDSKDKKVTYYVIFISNKDMLNNIELVDFINESKDKPVSIVIVGDAYEDLPHFCDVVLEKIPFNEKIHFIQENRIINLKLDGISKTKLEDVINRLAKIRVDDDVKRCSTPSCISFIDMMRKDTIDGLNIDKNYNYNNAYDNLLAPIGVDKRGKVLQLNLSEKGFGPHGLIAGMTGSGKTELIQALILSLAVRYNPEQLNFMLIDFKGGEMAHHFKDLPHVCGTITNLNEKYVSRAMVAIKSEMTRRQKMIVESGADNLIDYMNLFNKGEVAESIPKLIIIVDEFAELKKEYVEFIKELVSVAQKGRSLGLHLILATQKPSGNVDDNILCNSRFRICLRVQSDNDSIEVINKKDAAYIKNVGRGYISVGNGEYFEEFQTAWTGAYISNNYNGNSITQNDLIIKNIVDVSNKNKYKTNNIWLPTLEEKIVLADIRKTNKQEVTEGFNADIGLYDDVKNCKQGRVNIDFFKYGHLMICGNLGTGKTTLLQTLLYDLIIKYKKESFVTDIIEMGNGTLNAFKKADNVLNYAGLDDSYTINEIFGNIEEDLNYRKKKIVGVNYQEYINQNTKYVPVYLLVINNYVSFREYTNDRYEEVISRIIREGWMYGIYVAITTVTVGREGLPTHLDNYIRQKVCLNMREKYQYLDVLKVKELDILPEQNPGRGLMVINDSVMEIQVAVANDANTDYERGKLIENDIYDCI